MLGLPVESDEELLMDAVAALPPVWGLIGAACAALGLSRATFHRRQAAAKLPPAPVAPDPSPRGLSRRMNDKAVLASGNMSIWPRRNPLSRPHLREKRLAFLAQFLRVARQAHH